MINYLGTIWIGFLITWFFLLIIRMRLNYIIHKKQKLQLSYPSKQQSALATFFLSMFTLYNKPSKFEDTDFRRLKIYTNVLHLFFIYGFMAICFFSFIAFIVNDISQHELNRKSMNHQRETYCLEDVEPRFGQDYDSTREAKKLLPLPMDFCMSTSDEKTEIWEPRDIPNQTYFHQAKYVYIENGEWKGEYDIFVHREPNQQDENLTAEFTDLGGNLDVLYLYNDMGISERKFVEMMKEWGLEDELWRLHSN